MKTTACRKMIILSAVMSLLGSAAIWAHLEISPHEILLLPAAVGLYCLFSSAFPYKDKRLSVVSTILGLLFSAFMVLGNLNALSGTKGYAVWLLVRFLGFWAFFAAAVKVLFAKLSTVCLLDSDRADRTPAKCRRVFWLSLLIFCGWFFLWWLYEYPANTFPDTNTQLLQVMGVEKLSCNHPVLATVSLGFVFKLGLKLFSGNQNAAIALCSAAQAMIMAAVFAFVIESLFEFGVKKRAAAAVGAVYVLFPVYASYSISLLKDVLFSGFITLFCTSIWRMLQKNDAGRKICAWEIVLLYLSALLAGLFRNKCYYAFLLLTPILPFVFRRNSLWIRIMAPVVFCMAALINGPVYASMDIQHSDFIETYSIPAQHIARVIYDGHELSAEDRELISKAVDIERVPETYISSCTDPIKNLIRETGDMTYIERHSGEYRKLWLRLGAKYPSAYLRAQIDQTLGYWYPDVSYWTMGNYCHPSDELTIYKDRKTPGFMTSAFDEIGFYMPKLPLVGLAFSIGTAVWLMLALFALCVFQKQYGYLTVFVPILALWVTLLAVTPVYAEFRYIFPMYTTLPLLGVIPFCCRKNEKLPDRK